MDLVGLLVQQDHWKDNTLRKQDDLSLSVNRISLIAPEVTATKAAKGDLWIIPSDISKPTVESIPRLVIRMKVSTDVADFELRTSELQTRVRHSNHMSRGPFLESPEKPFVNLPTACLNMFLR